MPTQQLTCAEVDEQDLDVRYLAGRLSGDVADAFEQHYFGCDRCWGLVQRGLDARAGTAPTHGTRKAPVDRPRRVLRWWSLAAAATIAIAVGTWRFAATRGPPAEALRGRSHALLITARATERALTAAWVPVSGAAIYRVQLFAPDGRLLVDREVADTTVAFPVESLPANLHAALWKVAALDQLRNELEASGLAPAALPPTSP